MLFVSGLIQTGEYDKLYMMNYHDTDYMLLYASDMELKGRVIDIIGRLSFFADYMIMADE